MTTIERFDNNFLIPDVVLINMVRIGAIPVLDVRWMDERIGCRYARCDDPKGAATCPQLVTDSAGEYCALNGSKRSPCVFDESQSAPVWERIREQQVHDRRTEGEAHD